MLKKRLSLTRVDWISIDENEQCAAHFTEEEICSRIMGQAEQGGTMESDDEDDPLHELPSTKAPSHAEMLKALSVLNEGFQIYGEDFNLHYSYMKYVNNMLEQTKKQTKIDSFFHRTE